MSYDSLHKRLHGKIAKDTAKELKISNVLAVPKIEKVVINVGINKSKMDGKERIEYIGNTLAQITGQKPVFTRARKAISNFKVRENMIVGAMVTLRGKHMEDFLDRLISYSIPRIRDFRGLSMKLDGHGNYSIGIRDHSIFPEVPPPDAGQIFGLQVQITTTTNSDEEAMVLLKEIGMPFRRKQEDETEKSEIRISKSEKKEETATKPLAQPSATKPLAQPSATKPLERPSAGAGDEAKEAEEPTTHNLQPTTSKKEVVQEAIEFDDKKEDETKPLERPSAGAVEKKEDDSVEEKPVSPDTKTAS